MLDKKPATRSGPVRQVHDFKSGNEAAALAARDIGFHVMGYFPITPSTEVAEFLDEMKAEGLHDIVMIPSDGEHGAAGICYGATVGGGRVLNVTALGTDAGMARQAAYAAADVIDFDGKQLRRDIAAKAAGR